MDERIVQDLKNAWRNVNTATIGFSNNVPTDKWNSKPFDPRFKSFAWEFACLTRTRMCYLKGLKTGELKFSPQEDIPNKEILEKASKKEIFDHLSKLSQDILKEIEQLTEEKMSMVIWLLQHERIHHGKLMLYLSQAGFKLPESFIKTWGESNFPKKR